MSDNVCFENVHILIGKIIVQMEATLSASTKFKVPVNGRALMACTTTQKPASLKTCSAFGREKSGQDHTNAFHLPRLIVVFRMLLSCLLSQSAFRCSVLRTQWSHLTLPTKPDVQRIVLSAVPYMVFLIFYGINPYIHILPVASDIRRTNLKNVSVWESYLFPWQLHVIVSSVHFVALDFLAAVPYLGHYIIPVLYPVFLYLIDRLDLIQQFYRLLGLTMWGHYVIWLVLPTLPPWALEFIDAGQKANATNLAKAILLAHKEGPAFARIDSITGRPFFYGMFVGNPVPFGSFPSGHVAWPMCILLTLPANLRAQFCAYVAWMAWATLYTGHHFALDIVGALVLVLGLSRLMGYTCQTQSRNHILPL